MFKTYWALGTLLLFSLHLGEVEETVSETFD